MNIERYVQNSSCNILFFYILILASSIKQRMFTKVYKILHIVFFIILALLLHISVL